MADSEAVHEALRSLVTTAINLAFEWDGSLRVNGPIGELTVPEIIDTAANRAQLHAHRDRELPEAMPWIFVNMRSSAPALDSETVGHREYFWNLNPRVWAGFAHPSEEVRRAMQVAILHTIEDRLETDRTLGGVVDGVWALPPEDMEETAELGFPDTLFVSFPFQVYYASTRSSG